MDVTLFLENICVEIKSSLEETTHKLWKVSWQEENMFYMFIAETEISRGDDTSETYCVKSPAYGEWNIDRGFHLMLQDIVIPIVLHYNKYLESVKSYETNIQT